MSFVNNFVKKHPIKKLRYSNVIGEYIVGGQSTTGFLIFPGGGQDMYSSYDLIEAYENKYKVISLSINGFYNLKTFFQFINKILEKEKIDQVIVYGLSLGGFLAQHYIRENKDKTIKLILSHTASTRSKSVTRRNIFLLKTLYFFLPIIPLRLFKFVAQKNAGRAQSGSIDVKVLWKKYSTYENLEKRRTFIKKFGFNFINRIYLKSFYQLGVDMERKECLWKEDDLIKWSKNILILKTDNDPLAQDGGIFKKYYPYAKEYIFQKTGHLSPFIRFEEMKKIIDGFIVK